MGLIRWFRKRPSDEELREEVEAHLAMRAEHDGIDEHAARRRFGNTLQTRESIRRIWVAEFWDTIRQDARFTVRSLTRSPGFALTAVLVMAVGLGASTALFSVLDRILFRDLPYPNSDRLVSLGYMAPLDPREFMLDGEYVQLWRPAPEPFTSVTVIDPGAQVCDLTEDRPVRLHCTRVEANLLRVLGLRVAAGRDFLPGDDVPGPPPVVLIRHEFWTGRFGGDPEAIGRTLSIDGQPRRIVGVLPSGFELPTLAEADLLFPQQLHPHDPNAPLGSRTRFLRAFGRLKPGFSAQQALAAIQPVFAEMLKSVPQQFRNEVSFRVRPLRDRQMGDTRRMAWLLLGAVAVLLLIACVNVANLLLARVAARQREFTVRAALGAGRTRLARLALTEGLLIALAGCALGFGIAQALLRIFVAIAPQGIPKIEQASIDLRVGGVSLLFALAAGIGIALWPGVSLIRTNLLTGARTVGAIQPWARFGLVATQIALTVGLLSGAAMLLRSLWNFHHAPLGFETRNILAVPLTPNAATYTTPEHRTAFFEQVLERARQAPGTIAAALTDSLPPESGTSAMLFSNINVDGRPLPAEGTGGTVPWRSVTPGYFTALEIPIVRGRDLNDADVEGEPAIILSESLVRRLFPNEDPLGRRVAPGRSGEQWYTVVGVAKDVRARGPAEEVEPTYFLARRDGTAPWRRSTFLVLRTSADLGVTSDFLRQAIAGVDPLLPVEIETMEQRMAGLAQRPRFVAWLLASFAAVALLLAASGLYGVASYLVTQRTRDIGVRIALGATPGQIARHTIREAMIWVAGGMLFGQAVSYAGVSLLESQLFGADQADPLSWGASLLLLSAAVLLSVLRPALRAAIRRKCCGPNDADE